MPVDDRHAGRYDGDGTPAEPVVTGLDLELFSDPSFEESVETATLRRHRSAPRRATSRNAVIASGTALFLALGTVVAPAATNLLDADSGGVGFVNSAGVAALPRPAPTQDATPLRAEQEAETPAPETATPEAAEAAPAPEPAPPPAPVAVTQTVAAGETLGTIAQRCGTDWRRIYDANPDLEDPQLLYEGQVLRCPAPDEQIAQRELPAPEPEPTTREVAAEPADDPPPPADDAPAVPSGSVWDALAQCESGGNWAINTGNGYYGGLQFSLSSWRGTGGSGYPHEHSREEQIRRGEILQASSGWGAWPACSRKLGLR
jgi:LysM repeat protein